MSRPKFALLYIAIDNLKYTFKVFKRQKITGAFILAVILSIIAIIFSFLAFSPVLSPFIYPLF